MDALQFFSHSQLLDRGDEVIAVPDPEDVRVSDPEIYMKRLADIQTPKERLVEFIKSQLDFKYGGTHEAGYVRLMTITGLFVGWIYGGVFKSLNHYEEYRRKHNAAVFDNAHRAKRLYVDSFFYNIMRKGSKYGIGCAIFCGTSGLIAFGSTNYRNELYLPDWLLGFATLGGVSRCFLGLRGLAFGSGMGLLAGSFAYGCARLLEISSGNSVSQLRYIHHKEYLDRRRAILNRIHNVRKDVDREILSRVS